METYTVEFREDGIVSETFDELICPKCGAALELYEFYNEEFHIVCSSLAENPNSFEEGYISTTVKPGVYQVEKAPKSFEISA